MAVLAVEFKDTFQRAYQQFEQEINETANDGSQRQIKATKTLLMKKKVDLTWDFWMQHRQNAAISAWFEGACIAGLLCPSSTDVERFFSVAGGKTKKTQKKMKGENMELKSCLAFNDDDYELEIVEPVEEED